MQEGSRWPCCTILQWIQQFVFEFFCCWKIHLKNMHLEITPWQIHWTANGAAAVHCNIIAVNPKQENLKRYSFDKDICDFVVVEKVHFWKIHTWKNTLANQWRRCRGLHWSLEMGIWRKRANLVSMQIKDQVGRILILLTLWNFWREVSQILILLTRRQLWEKSFSQGLSLSYSYAGASLLD